MSSFKTVILGDSVAWGQGLKEAQKLHSISAKLIANALNLGSETVNLAHSGAVINNADSSLPVNSRISYWQEVPHSSPSILDQARTNLRNPDYNAKLVIIVGGINDINFRRIIDPFISEKELEKVIEANCYHDVIELVRLTQRSYPNAVIMVAGYYPILSEDSNIAIARIMAMLSLFYLGVGATIASDFVAHKSIRNARYFHKRQLFWFSKAITELNSDKQVKGAGLNFINPAFGPKNSVGSSNSLLFSPKRPSNLNDWMNNFIRDPITNYLQIEPNDPVSTHRRYACELAGREGADLLQCRIASLGHPNHKGAKQYAERIVEVYLSNRRISLANMLRKLFVNNSNLSLRKVFNNYNLPSENISIKYLNQFKEVESIKITIKTKDEVFAGTDHDIYFRINSNRRWRLNETLFEGDLTNDFERGSLKAYAIDPTDGDPEKRLKLWDIKELSLQIEMALEGVGLGTWNPDSVLIHLNGFEIYRSSLDVKLSVFNKKWTALNYPNFN